jgi:hypothetical protein
MPNPAEEILGRESKEHNWNRDEWYDYLMAEIYKPQQDNLIHACIAHCVNISLDHQPSYLLEYRPDTNL